MTLKDLCHHVACCGMFATRNDAGPWNVYQSRQTGALFINGINSLGKKSGQPVAKGDRLLVTVYPNLEIDLHIPDVEVL